MVISIICKDDLHLNFDEIKFIYEKFGMGVIVESKNHLVLKTDDILEITEDTNIISESVESIWDYVAYISQIAA